MVDRGDDVELEFLVRGGLEDTRIDFDLLNSRAVEFFESCDNSGFLASARGAVNKEVGEVAGLCLTGLSWGCWLELRGRLTRERRRSERSSW